MIRRCIHLSTIVCAGSLLALSSRAQTATPATATTPTTSSIETQQPAVSDSDAATAEAIVRNRYVNGIVAVVEDKVITNEDVYQQLQLSLPGIAATAKNQKDFMDKANAAMDRIIQDLIDRELIIKEFRKPQPGQKEVRRIPDSYIDQEISRQEQDDFGGDRSKFLAYIKSLGLTREEYRKRVEEQIIYDYMRSQQRQSQNIVSPVKIETYYNENKDKFYQEDSVHMRLLQLNRKPGETDTELRTRLQGIADEFHAGAKFEDLVRKYSDDTVKRSKGGDWGVMHRDDLAPEFADPVMSLKTGEITDPIIIKDYGYLIYCEDREYAGIQPLDKVRDQIEQLLSTQMDVESREKWLERMRQAGYVKIF